MFKPGDKVIRFKNHDNPGWSELRLDKNHICIVKKVSGTAIYFTNVPDNESGMWNIKNFTRLVVNKEFKYKKQGGNI